MKVKNSFSDQILQWLNFTCTDYLFEKESNRAEIISVFIRTAKVMEIGAVETDSVDSQNFAVLHQFLVERQQVMRQRNILSIILWEDLWENKTEIVKSRLLALLRNSVRIPGRLTYAARINKTVCDDFFYKNHLQGSVSSKYRYGLFLPQRYFRVLPEGFLSGNEQEDMLVAAGTFSNARIFTKNEKPFRSHELIRFANLLNVTVVGGLDKLLSAFTKEFQPDDIMTYVDSEWSDGSGYTKLGFERISVREPVNFWLDPHSNERFSERNLPERKDLIRINNAGSIKFVKTINKVPALF